MNDSEVCAWLLVDAKLDGAEQPAFIEQPEGHPMIQDREGTLWEINLRRVANDGVPGARTAL
jgi:hypothetical protein